MAAKHHITRRSFATMAALPLVGLPAVAEPTSPAAEIAEWKAATFAVAAAWDRHIANIRATGLMASSKEIETSEPFLAWRASLDRVSAAAEKMHRAILEN